METFSLSRIYHACAHSPYEKREEEGKEKKKKSLATNNKLFKLLMFVQMCLLIILVLIMKYSSSFINDVLFFTIMIIKFANVCVRCNARDIDIEEAVCLESKLRFFLTMTWLESYESVMNREAYY
uniref:Uncharacterized protein n=1 Tax=Glossina austeni TaxID=7395 RepID=A0A1A9UHI2_GLOAU